MNQKDYIESLVIQYGGMIKKIVCRIVKNHQNIDDIIQDTFIKIIENVHNLDERSNIRAYIAKIAANTINDYLRIKYRYDELYVYVWDWNQIVDIESEERRCVDYGVRKYVDMLPLEYRNVVKCVYYKEMSIQEVASYLGINQATIRTRLHRGRNRLREYIEKYSNISRCI